MKQKNILGKGNRIFLFVLQQLIAVIVAISLTTIILNSSLQVGMYNDHVFLNPLEYDMEFEKSDIYQTLLEKGIRDAVRMSVIKSQLETDGEFDGNKEIDVTAYVNRAEQLSGKYVTAAYRLEDLLKWGKYGFEYTGRVFESVKEMDDFLASTTTYTQYEGTYTTGFHPVQEESRKEYEMLWETDTAVSVEMIDEPEAQTEAAEYYEMTDAEADGNTRSVIVFDRGEEESVYADAEEAVDAEDLYQTLLSNRYQTTDQKTPEELVSTWEEYYQLCDNIRVAATSLYSNYREYLDYEKSYSIENSNLLYCMIMMVDGKNVCFTNVTLPDLTISAINDYFNKFQNTIYYSPYDMEYHTTTGVTEDYFLRLMNAYNYAYTENTKIWIAVDDNYDADDVFAKAEYTFNHLLPSWWKYAAVIAGGISVWIALLVLMSWFTGRKIVIEGAEETDDVLEGAGEEIIDHLVDQEGAQKAYQGFVEKLQGMMKNMAFSDSYAALDVKTMSVLYKQISFMGNMAREENYEIPTDVGGVLTSINLKIIHNDAKESKVAITFESELIGKTAAEFKMTKQGLSGFGICGSKDGCRLLNDNKDILERKLKGEKIQVGEIYFAVGENLDMTEFSLKETQNRKTGNDSQMLYKAAKAFIGYVQEIGMKKGNTAYENQL